MDIVRFDVCKRIDQLLQYDMNDMQINPSFMALLLSTSTTTYINLQYGDYIEVHLVYPQ